MVHCFAWKMSENHLLRNYSKLSMVCTCAVSYLSTLHTYIYTRISACKRHYDHVLAVPTDDVHLLLVRRF